MLSEQAIERKKKIEKILDKSKNDFELINQLRTKCERIDFLDKNIILNFENEKFEIDKEKAKITKITIFDEKTNNLKEILF